MFLRISCLHLPCSGNVFASDVSATLASYNRLGSIHLFPARFCVDLELLFLKYLVEFTNETTEPEVFLWEEQTKFI